MASPAYRSHNRTAYALTGESVAPSKPAGLANNDLVLLGVLLFSETPNGLSAEEVITWPAGFTEIRSAYQNAVGGQEVQIAAAYKFVTNAAGEPATYTISWTGTIGNSGVAAAYSGVHSVGLIDDSAEGVGTGVTVTFPAVTAEAADTLFVALGTNWAGSAQTHNDGLTERETATGSVMLGDEVIASAGAVSADTVTITSGTWAALTILLASLSTLAREQEGYRFRNDDGSESGATWLASQDTNISLGKLSPARLRILTNVTSDPPSEALKLQYRRVGDTTWRDVS